MRSSAFSAYVDFDDDIRIVQNKDGNVDLKIGNCHLFELSNKQLLDLGMKIQSVVNGIDRENRLAREKGNKAVLNYIPKPDLGDNQ